MRRHDEIYGCSVRHLAICLGGVVAMLALVFGMVACGADDVAGASCDEHADCPYGTVCSDGGECVEAECGFCDLSADSTCDPENDEVCCDPYDELCTPPCQSDDDCDDEQCVAGICGGEGGQACGSSEDCPDGFSCHPVTNECVPGGDTVDCSDNEDCSDDEICEDGNCVPDDTCQMTEADCTGETPYLDEDNCECVECTGSEHCEVMTEQCIDGTCTSGGDGQCQSGVTCDDGCGGDFPYCIEDCCVECIGAGDCSGDAVCNEDGFCASGEGCDNDSDCPSGYECEGNQCVPPASGGQCQDNEDCPDGQFCDPMSNQCEGLGGGAGCGMCNDDCTCDGDLECDPMLFVCTGCVWLDGDCADDECCYPLSLDGTASLEDFLSMDEGMCMPDDMCPL